MQTINSIITAVFDLIFLPFSGMAPVWGLLTVSALTGVVMVVIFKYTSNQTAIRNAKDKISAYFMEIRLFKDDLALMFDAQRRILRTNLTYMRHAVTPMLVMIVPVVLILAQLGTRYTARPLRPGESVLVKVKLAGDVSVEDVAVTIETGDGLRRETPLLRIPATGEIDFRIGALKEGDHEISILVGDSSVSKTIVVSSRLRRVYVSKTQPDFFQMLLYPGQDPLPKGSAVDEITVNFPPQSTTLLGWNVNWLVLFFIASLVAGYSLKGVFKVEV